MMNAIIRMRKRKSRDIWFILSKLSAILAPFALWFSVSSVNSVLKSKTWVSHDAVIASVRDMWSALKK